MGGKIWNKRNIRACLDGKNIITYQLLLITYHSNLITQIQFL